MLNYINYYANVITNPLYIIYERSTQTIESLKTLIYKKSYGLYGSSVEFKNNNDKNITISAINVLNYYDQSSLQYDNDIIKFISGHVIDNDDDRFGSWSGMTFDDSGKLILVSDNGAFLKTDILFVDGALSSFDNAVIGTIKNKDGDIFKHKDDKDFEEIKFFNGDCYLVSENKDGLLKYNHCDFSKLSDTVFTPYWSPNFSFNRGIEAFGFNKEGKILAIEEYTKGRIFATDKDFNANGALHRAYYWDSKYLDSNQQHFAKDIKILGYQSLPGYGVSGMTFLDNGDMLVLERHYSKKAFGFAEDYNIDIKFVCKADIEKAIADNSIPIKGLSILHINNNSNTGLYSFADNFESIAVREHENIVHFYIATDDNRAGFQRSMILEFEFDITTLLDYYTKDSIIPYHNSEDDMNLNVNNIVNNIEDL